MINHQEIFDHAGELGLDPNIVEKDYVLGWILAGISNNLTLSSKWVFKGGTCLKKCYFETYRFSEDLDFTVINSSDFNEEFILDSLSQITDWIHETSGVVIFKDETRVEFRKNHRGGLVAEGRIYYQGPLERGGSHSRIKLDLTSDEVIILDTENRIIKHPYTDNPTSGIRFNCYCYEEVFAEKVRALSDRERPRDLYDVIHLFRNESQILNRDLIKKTIEEKCKFKGLPNPTLALLETKPERAELEAEWENMLGHQLPETPPFEHFWNELPLFFAWLYGEAELLSLNSIPLQGQRIDNSWTPPLMLQELKSGAPLEVVRFAAANRLCVNLGYLNKYRLIEPYSLRKTRVGNILLYAVKRESGEIRAYRVDRIQKVQISQEPFSPRYAVELSPLSSTPTPVPSQNLPALGNKRFRKKRTRSIGRRT